jgi:hypothetical protein
MKRFEVSPQGDGFTARLPEKLLKKQSDNSQMAVDKAQE